MSSECSCCKMRSPACLWLVTVNEACWADYWFRKWGQHKYCALLWWIKDKLCLIADRNLNEEQKQIQLPVQVPRQSNSVLYLKTGTFMVASNKQMVELTYLCFVFLNDRSDAWWEMQWAACQGRDNSRERGPVEAAYILNLVPSLWFLRLVIFFLHYYWLLREQLFPSLLPFRITIFTLTDKKLMGKLTACMRRSNSAMKLMCCIEGGDVTGQKEEEEEGLVVQVWTDFGSDLDGIWEKTAASWWRREVRSILYLFIYLIIYSFIYSVPRIPESCFWLQIPNWQLSTACNESTQKPQIHFSYLKESSGGWTQ